MRWSTRRFIMTDMEKVEFVMERLEVDAFWLFQRAFDFAEIREECWFLSWKVRDFREKNVIPECVITLVDAMLEDNKCLFFRKECD